MPRPIRSFCSCLLLAVAAGCSRAPRFETFQDPWGDYRLETPQGWQTWGSQQHKKPINAVMFVGKIEAEDNGMPLGVVLSVTKLYRKRADYPGSDSQYEKYRRDILVPSSVLFGESPSKLPEAMRKLLPSGVSDASLSGLPARTYARGYDQSTSTSQTMPMKLEDILVQKPDAYYVIEYRATDPLFDRYHFAFERAKTSFKFLQ